MAAITKFGNKGLMIHSQSALTGYRPNSIALLQRISLGIFGAKIEVSDKEHLIAIDKTKNIPGDA